MCKKRNVVVYSDEYTGFISPSSTCFRDSRNRELCRIKKGDEIWVETYSEQCAGPLGYVKVTVVEVKEVKHFHYKEVYWENEYCSGMTKVFPAIPHMTRVFQLRDYVQSLEIVKAAA